MQTEQASADTATEAAEGATERATAASDDSRPKKKPKKKRVLKPLFIFVPMDIEDVNAVDPEIPIYDSEEDNPDNVEPVAMPVNYKLFVVPGGPGRLKAVDRILSLHNIDPRTVGRVRIFSGEKNFSIAPQYNIRFK